MRRVLRIGFVVLIIGLFLLGFWSAIISPEADMPFEKWYGNWPTVVVVTTVIPQYLGLLVIVVAFLFMWPTLALGIKRYTLGDLHGVLS